MLNRFRNLIRTNNRNTSTKAGATSAIRHAAIDTLEDRRMMAVSGGAIGINVNDGSTSFMNHAAPIMKSLGVTSVRLWYTTDMNSRTFGGVLSRAIDYSNKGFDVTLIVQPQDGKVFSTSAVKGWFEWATGNTALKNAVDRWEIGNEPDHKEYWQGSLSSYVSQLLKPASEVLHAAGEKVVSAGPSWDSSDVKDMIGDGLLNYADYVGYHPYAKGVKLVQQRISEINAVVAGRKPIMATEWNVRGFESDKTAWAQAVEDVYPAIKSGFAFNYYFALKVMNSYAGPGGILKTDGSKNEPFYNAFATFSGASGGVTITPPGTSTSGGSTSGGNTSSGTGSIAGSLWNDSDGDGAWDSNESNSGSRVVFIDANGNGTLDSSEKRVTSSSSGTYSFTGLSAGTYKVTRVFPSSYHLSNSTSKFLTVTVNPGQKLSGVNLGSTDQLTSGSTPSTTSPTTPTTGTGSATITGTLWNDSDKDGKWDSNESVSGSRSVFLDYNGNGKLDAGEKTTTSSSSGVYKFANLAAGTYKVGRVFPSGYKLSNSSSGYITASVTNGQYKSGVNLGSRTI